MKLALQLVALAMTWLLLPAHASADASADLSGLAWEHQAVRYPVERSAIRLPLPPVQHGRHMQSEVRGPILLEPGKSAAFRLGSMRFIRVRMLSGKSTSALRFHRVIGGHTEAAQPSMVQQEEHPQRVDETTWYLVQPPPDGDLWVISATEPVTVAIERPLRRRARLAWSVARDRLFRWVETGGAMPVLPEAPGTALMKLRLRGEQALANAAAAYFGETSGMDIAMKLWRKASADLALLGVRRLVRPFLYDRDLIDDKEPGFGRKEFVYRGHKGTRHSPIAYRRNGRATARLLFSVDAPDVIEINVRAIWDKGDEPRSVRITVHVDNTELVSKEAILRPLQVSKGAVWKKALPSKVLLLTRNGARVSRTLRISVPVLLGEHIYEVSVEGGPVLVSARKWRPRARLRELVAGTTGAESFLRRARSNIASEEEEAKTYLQTLAKGLAGTWSPIDEATAATLPPLLELWSLALASRADDPPVRRRPAIATRIGELVSMLPDDTDSDAMAVLVVDLTRALKRWGQARTAQLLLGYAESQANPLAVATIMALGTEEAQPGRRARILAAALSAWVQGPLDDGLRDLALRVWHERTAWSLLQPSRDEDTSDDDVQTRKWWLRSTESKAVGGSSPRLLRLERGQPQTMSVPAHPVSPTRPARLRLFLYKEGKSAGATVRFRVDDDIWSIPLAEDSELVDFALPPGTRTVELVAGKGVGAFAAIPTSARDKTPAGGAPMVDGHRTLSHLPAGNRATYQVPDPGLPGPLLLQVRTPADHGTAPVTLYLTTDRGKKRELVMVPGSIDPQYMPQGGQPYLSAPATMVLWLEDGTSSIHLDSPAAVWLSLSVRRASSPSVVAEPSSPSRRLFDKPSVLELARHDRMQWRDFIDRGNDKPATFARHLASISGSGYWPHQEDPSWERPMVISPASVVALHALRQDEAQSAGTASSLATVRECERNEEALCLAKELARLYQETDVWQLGMGAIEAMRRVETRVPDVERWMYATALGVVEKATLATGWLGLLELGRTVEARRLSSWDRAAGVLRIWSARPAIERGPRTVFLSRLAPASWGSSTGRVIRHGRREEFKVQLDKAGSLRPQMICQPLDGLERQACPLRWRVDSRAWQELTLMPAQMVRGEAVHLEQGEHTITIELGVMEAPSVVAYRLLDDRDQPVVETRKRRYELTRPDAPAQVAVDGPGSVWLEARSVKEATSIEVELISPAGAADKQIVLLETTIDKHARIDGSEKNPAQIRLPSAVVLPLPETGTYTLRVRVSQGEAGVRAYSLVDTPPKTQTKSRAIADVDLKIASDRPSWAKHQLVVPPGLRVLPRRGAPGTTLSLRAILGQDDLGDRGDDDDSLQDRAEIRTTWRHRFSGNRLWLGGHLGMRTLNTATSYNVGADTYLNELPGKLRISGRARVFAQDHVDQLAWRLATRMRVDRGFSLTPNSFGLAALALRVSHYSLDVEEVDMSQPPDPLVFANFGALHSRGLSLEWGHYWTPLLDQMGWGVLRVVSNEDLRTVDRFEAVAGWRGVAEWGAITGPEYRFMYQPSLRIADAHRREDIVRHDLLFRIDWTLWTGNIGRFVLSFADDLYLSSQVENRNSLRIEVRFDWSGTRSLSDWMPPERDFEDIIERRLWAGYQ